MKRYKGVLLTTLLRFHIKSNSYKTVLSNQIKFTQNLRKERFKSFRVLAFLVLGFPEQVFHLTKYQKELV